MPTTAREDLFLRCSDLQLRVKNLERELDEFKSGKRYLKLQEDHRLVVAGYIKEIQRLKSELAKANARTVTFGQKNVKRSGKTISPLLKKKTGR